MDIKFYVTGISTNANSTVRIRRSIVFLVAKENDVGSHFVKEDVISVDFHSTGAQVCRQEDGDRGTHTQTRYDKKTTVHVQIRRYGSHFIGHVYSCSKSEP